MNNASIGMNGKQIIWKRYNLLPCVELGTTAKQPNTRDFFPLSGNVLLDTSVFDGFDIDKDGEAFLFVKKINESHSSHMLGAN